MKRPITIYMADLVHDILPGIYIVPLNISSISAYITGLLGRDVRIKVFKSPSALLAEMKKDPPQILALSNYLWNQHLTSQIGRAVKKDLPDVIIVVGGPGIRIDKEGVKRFLKKNRYIDIYTLFEGEQPFLNFIRKILGRSDAGKKGLKGDFADGGTIKGCSYLMDGDLVYSEHDILSDLTALPSPYLTGWLDEFLGGEFIPLFESNRGCPFSCTYCNWGVSALRKVRPFALERVCDEMEYVARKNPRSPHWIIADANFGILERDVEIARKIRAIKERTCSLKRVYAWTTKNKLKRSIEISQMLGDAERHLIAVQTFDPKVQVHAGRSNIRQEEIPAVVESLKGKGIAASTDVLCGLPSESAESHIKTLRKCFDIGFDFIGAGNTILLPGSELENDSSRERFSIKTKFRLLQGAYGAYGGIKAIECEELIVGTSTMTEDETLEFRMIHWLIYLCWNTGFLKPLLRYLQSRHKINAMDVMVDLIKRKKADHPRIDRLFEQFRHEAQGEKFDSPTDLRKHYSRKDRFDLLLKGGFSKMNFKFIAVFVLDKRLYAEFCDLVDKAASSLAGEEVPAILSALAKESVIDVDDLFHNETVLRKKMWVGLEMAAFLLKEKTHDGSGCAHVSLSKDPQEILFLKKLLIKHKFDGFKRLAVEKSLEIAVSAFAYQIEEGAL